MIIPMSPKLKIQTKPNIKIEDWSAKAIRQQLQTMAEPDYAKFSTALKPSDRPLMGVRIPTLRLMAKELSKAEVWEKYLKEAANDSFEEFLLQGMVIGNITSHAAKAGYPSVQQSLQMIDGFVRQITGWSECDSFCTCLKLAVRQPQAIWDTLTNYLQSGQPYSIRYALVMMRGYYIQAGYLKQILNVIENIQSQHYYVQMAAAWTLCECVTKIPQESLAVFERGKVQPVIQNLAIQKCVDSFRISDTDKKWLKTRKIRMV